MRRHLMKAGSLFSISTRARSSLTQGEAVIAGGGKRLRGNNNAKHRYSTTSIASDGIQRELEDNAVEEEEEGVGNDDNAFDDNVAEKEEEREAADDENVVNDDVAEEEEAAANYDYDYHNSIDDDAWYERQANDTQQSSSTVSNIINRVHTWENKAITGFQSWESNANSTAWDIYESSPSQWTTSQWDLIYSLLFWIGIMSCACVACCDRCSDGHDEKDDEDEDGVRIERLNSLPPSPREEAPHRSTPASRPWGRKVNNSSLRNQLTDDDHSTMHTEIMDVGQIQSSTTSYQLGRSLVVLLIVFLFMIVYTLWLGKDQSFYGLMRIYEYF